LLSQFVIDEGLLSPYVIDFRIERIATEKLGITGDTAVRLGKVLGTGPEVWMNRQSKYETETAKIALDDVIETLPVLNKAA